MSHYLQSQLSQSHSVRSPSSSLCLVCTSSHMFHMFPYTLQVKPVNSDFVYPLSFSLPHRSNQQNRPSVELRFLSILRTPKLGFICIGSRSAKGEETLVAMIGSDSYLRAWRKSATLWSKNLSFVLLLLRSSVYINSCIFPVTDMTLSCLNM